MDLKNHLDPTLSAMCRDMFHQTSLLKAISNQALSIARVGASTSLGNLFQCPTIITTKNFFLISYIKLPSFNLYPVFTSIRKPGNPSKSGVLAAAHNCVSNLAQGQSVHSGKENSSSFIPIKQCQQREKVVANSQLCSWGLWLVKVMLCLLPCSFLATLYSSNSSKGCFMVTLCAPYPGKCVLHQAGRKADTSHLLSAHYCFSQSVLVWPPSVRQT